MVKGTRVQVRRERPSALTWSIALTVTMLVVYVATLDASGPDVVESVSAAPRVTREIAFDALEGWCAGMGRWADAGSARIEAAAYVSRGSAGCVTQLDGAWQVIGAMYPTKKQAERAVRRLKDEGVDGAEVLRLEADKVDMRVTAPERQIELIAAASDAIRAQIEQLPELARQVDRGELQPDAARSLCAVAATEAGELAKDLKNIPGAEDNALCAALIARLSALQQALKGASGGGSALSSQLRLAGIDAFLGLRDLQEALAHGGI